jgi:nicotinamide riboside transporter PnuC
MNINREPAVLYMSLVAPLAQLVLILWPALPPGAQSILTGVVPALMGVVIAVLVRAEKLLPLIIGLAQAALTAALAFGLHLTVDQQSAILGFVSLAAGVVIRDRVEAPVPLERHV